MVYFYSCSPKKEMDLDVVVYSCRLRQEACCEFEASLD